MIALVSQENAVISLKTETKAERNRTEEDSWCVAAAALSFSIFPQKSAVETAYTLIQKFANVRKIKDKIEYNSFNVSSVWISKQFFCDTQVYLTLVQAFLKKNGFNFALFVHF